MGGQTNVQNSEIEYTNVQNDLNTLNTLSNTNDRKNKFADCIRQNFRCT